MDGHSASLEEIEEYHMMVSQMFASEKQGYEHYNRYARAKGFSVRLDDKEYVKGTREVKARRFCCSKQGHRLEKYFHATDQKGEPRALTRCGCKAMLEIQHDAGRGQWFVNKFVDVHNHPLADPDQSAFLRSHRRMNDAQKADAVEYGLGGLRTFQIMNVAEKHHGGYPRVGYISRDLYNFFARKNEMQILLPLNAGLHWYVAALDAPKREVQILNSAPGCGPTDELDYALKAITKWFQMAEEKIKQLRNPTNWPDFNVASWKKKTIKGLPTQKDGSSCGLYLLKYIMLWTGSKLSKTFSKKDIDMYRRELAHYILNSDRNLLRENMKPDQRKPIPEAGVSTKKGKRSRSSTTQ